MKLRILVLTMIIITLIYDFAAVAPLILLLLLLNFITDNFISNCTELLNRFHGIVLNFPPITFKQRVTSKKQIQNSESISKNT